MEMETLLLLAEEMSKKHQQGQGHRHPSEETLHEQLLLSGAADFSCVAPRCFPETTEESGSCLLFSWDVAVAQPKCWCWELSCPVPVPCCSPGLPTHLWTTVERCV